MADPADIDNVFYIILHLHDELLGFQFTLGVGHFGFIALVCKGSKLCALLFTITSGSDKCQPGLVNSIVDQD